MLSRRRFNTKIQVAIKPINRKATLPEDFPFGFDDSEEGSNLKVTRCEPGETLLKIVVGTPIDQPRSQ